MTGGLNAAEATDHFPGGRPFNRRTPQDFVCSARTPQNFGSHGEIDFRPWDPLTCMEGTVLISGREFVSLPFVVFGVLDYLRICDVKRTGGSPVDVLLSSPAIMACGAGWSLAALRSVGLL